MRSPFLLLHTAIGDRIVLKTSFTEVFDSTPENETFPYITMGNLRALDWSDKSFPGQEVVATVHIWSQYEGKKQILELNDEVIQALTKWGSLNLGSGFNAVVDTFDDNNVIMDLDGITRHAIISVKYLIEER